MKTIGPTAFAGTFNACSSNLENPWGTGTTQPTPPNGDPSALLATSAGNGCVELPNAAQLESQCIPFYLAVYNRNNKLPYTMNSTLDIQWQPRNDLAIDIGYVNALGRHEIIPVPFNQARIASPTNPLCGPAAVCANPSGSPHAQFYTYGYTPSAQAGCNYFGQFTVSPACDASLPNGTQYQFNSEGGNIDERVPYIGYAGESLSYSAAGVSAYNALQAHVEKRLAIDWRGGRP